MIGLLLRCYPARWRARYGEEFAELLAERPLGPFDVADVLLGALDARLHLRGLGAEDEIAVEALELFILWLGRFAGDAALLLGARGGVYLGGGITPKLTAKLASGPFRQAFEDKGRMAAYLAPIPVYVIRADFATLTGAAASVRGRVARRTSK